MQAWDSRHHVINPSMCGPCGKDLSACVRVQCPFCPTTTCVACSHEHSQAHDRYNSDQPSSPDARTYHPEPSPLSPPTSPPMYTPWPMPTSSPGCPPPQRPPFYQGVPYYPPPPNSFPSSQQYRPQQDRNVFPGPPNQFHQPGSTARGHRNWVAWSIDKGTAAVKHPVTKKFMKTGAKVALVGVSLGVGADLTGLADMGSDSGFGSSSFTGDSGANMVGDGSSPNVAAPNLSPEIAMMNSAAFYQPLQSCTSMNPNI